MKKLFKLISLLKLLAELRGHARHGRHSHGRSRDYYPLYGRRRRSLVDRLVHRYLSRRSY